MVPLQSRSESEDREVHPRAVLQPDKVVASRRGEVLIKYTILKSDHFPGCQNKKLLPLLEGAPNFRQVPELPVYGVAIPTVSGLRLVLDELGAEQGRRKVIWANMREEPVLYINGKPYVVRESTRPFANLEYTGIDRSRVEAMEARLKADVLREAAQYGAAIMVAHENDDFQVVEQWEAVTEVDVQTPLEVYAELAEDGYDVEYLRVPVTDEKAPKERDLAELQARLGNPPEGAALMFNCQMGRGRTTTGMVIASLLQLRRRMAGAALPKQPLPGLPAWFSAKPALATPRGGGQLGEDDLRAGRYGVIRSLLRTLEGGGAAKALLDAVLDAAAAMQNLREAIAGYRGRLMQENVEDKRNALLQVCLEYLERYYVLITFTAFLFDPAAGPCAPPPGSFGQWTARRPELRSVLERMLRRNPLAALALHRPARPDPPSPGPQQGPPADASPGGASDDEATETAEDATALLIANRSGAVLGAHTLLKEDHFPGCQSPKLALTVPGAPNFRGVPGQRVYGSALPTLEGIRGVLQHTGCAPGAAAGEANGEQVRARWVNMREELNIYINGKPYVLREDERPFKNMQEYSGIEASRLEQMEARLKADMLHEAHASGGRLLVAREQARSGDPDSGLEIIDVYEPIAGPESVQTPKEVYQALTEAGWHVDYLRLPQTDGVAPREAACDAVFEAVSAAGADDPIVFNCQMGAGRTTTGMVIACLVRCFTTGTGRVEPEPSLTDELAGLSPRSVASDDMPGRSPRLYADEEDDKMIAAGLSPSDTLGTVPGGSGRAGKGSGSEASTPTAARAGASSTPFDASLARSERDAEGDALEAAALREGEYVGVRRFTRTLERGGDAKAVVDAFVDRCGALLNLRTEILLYRRPRRSFRFYRPEINVRHTAFKRGSAYLERYCMLITFAAYLERNRPSGHVLSFRQWVASRPDIISAREAIHQNPAGALAPVPMAHLPHLWLALDRQQSREVTADELRRVLGKRRGSTLSRRSILKSYQPHTNPRHNAFHVEGVSNVRQARGLPVYTVGSCSVQGLRNLLSHLGAPPGGPVTVVVSDVREELVGYVNGLPYLRRELEMPSAALHHAGIQAVKLEELERRLRNDVVHEALAWGGRVLLHREVPRSQAYSPLTSPTAAAAAAAASDLAHSGGSVAAGVDSEDVTRQQEDACVAAFWEPTGSDVGDIDAGLATPLEVWQGLAAEGYNVAYRRLPLSRERTPEAADLDVLHRQLLTQPDEGGVAHLILSRTATGSSVRFAAAFAADPSLTPVVRQSASLLGEYRGIMNLCRVLPAGVDAKLLVDEAIDRCARIGNLRDDVLRCKRAAEAACNPIPNPNRLAGQGASAAAAARRLGLHYLRRYFYLIAFFACMGGGAPPRSFARWMAERSELKHMLSTLSFEPAI
ncbi:hypothetical protein WJX81_000925 [Elliptochloris bilobata]|uniref:Paladin n=1 Tax=Elliptochloris bilobata TaxID=381761 RepID=A0AAW1S193_9CHLO